MTEKALLNPEQWVNNHADYLYNCARFKLPSKETAEDLVQETFLSAYHSKKSFAGASSERTWLVAILKRRIVDYYRKEAKNQEQNMSSYQLPFNDSGDFENHWIEQRAPKVWEVDDKIQMDEFHRIFQLCLSLLPPNHRTVFVMKVLELCSSDKICEEIQISSGNLWTIMHRARLQLRECIEKNGCDASKKEND